MAENKRFLLYRDNAFTGVSRATKKAAINYAETFVKSHPEHHWYLIDAQTGSIFWKSDEVRIPFRGEVVVSRGQYEACVRAAKDLGHQYDDCSDFEAVVRMLVSAAEDKAYYAEER